VKLPAILGVVLVAAALSGNGAADTVVGHDDAGRPITFDVQAPGVDVDWYASVLSRAAHGDEIETVTIRIVPGEEIQDRCGHVAAACYTGSPSAVVTVPAGQGTQIAAILLHEYAHHIDRAWPVDGVPEPNGTPVWWAMRGMDELRRSGAVARNYSLGWDRGIGEIFAEDYAHAELGDAYGIGWLYPPAPALKKALLAEVRGEPTAVPPPAKASTMTRPVTIADSGTLAPGGSHAESFRLLGPGRHVTLTAVLSAPGGDRSAGRATVTCDGAVVKSAQLVAGHATLDLPRLGPASCRASLVSTSTAPRRYSFRLRLTLQA